MSDAEARALHCARSNWISLAGRNAWGYPGTMKTRPGICNRKRRYDTREAAEAAAAQAPFRMRAYKCSLCKRYHLTSRTKGMKTPRHEIAEREP